MNQAHLEDVRGLFTFDGQEELDAKQEAFSTLDHSAQIFALGVLLVATLDAVYLVGQTLDPEPEADTNAEPQTDAPPAPPRRLALSSSTSSPAAPASEASTSSPAAPASEASTSSPAAPASEPSAPFEVR